jgi:hypothetical protein
MLQTNERAARLGKGDRPFIAPPSRTEPRDLTQTVTLEQARMAELASRLHLAEGLRQSGAPGLQQLALAAHYGRVARHLMGGAHGG